MKAKSIHGASERPSWEYKDGNNVDADMEEWASQPNDGSMHNVEDWGHSTRECEEWTVYARPVKYNNGETNPMASDVTEANTVFQ
jgi:hypothetical protein